MRVDMRLRVFVCVCMCVHACGWCARVCVCVRVYVYACVFAVVCVGIFVCVSVCFFSGDVVLRLRMRSWLCPYLLRVAICVCRCLRCCCSDVYARGRGCAFVWVCVWYGVHVCDCMCKRICVCVHSCDGMHV